MAAQNYTLNFTNGTAAAVSLPVGTYTYVSNTVTGYESGTVSTFTVTPTTTAITLEITAAGTLNVVVTDDLGNAITAGSLQLSDATGTTRYGAAATISDTGTASFENVPYSAGGITFAIAQDSSDASHDPITVPQSVTMTTTPQQADIENARKSVSVTATLSDAVYAGITPLNGAVVVNG